MLSVPRGWRESRVASDCLGFLESTGAVKWFKPSDLEIKL